jgi:FkbM family methyltransferase
LTFARTGRRLAGFLRNTRFFGNKRGIGRGGSASTRATLDEINARLQRLENLLPHASTVYIGNDRLIAKVTVGGFDLMYFLEADDRLITPAIVTSGSWEPEVTNFFIRRISPHSHCLDIGANFGYYSVLMARCARLGKTLSLEPNEKVFELLRDNIFLNAIQEIATPLHAAIADELGTLTLYRRYFRSGNTSMIYSPKDFTDYMGEKETEPFEIESVTIDSLLEHFDGRIDFIKIDVEGAEPLALRGAEETISENPDITIVMEWAPSQIRGAGFDVADFTNELSELGLQPASLGLYVSRPMTWDAVRNTEYLSGLLLTRRK